MGEPCIKFGSLLLISIMRMIGIIPVFTILSWGATEILYTKGQMILIVEDLYESFAFASFFLLVVAWVERSRDEKLVSYKTRQSPSPSRGSEDSTASDEIPAIPKVRLLSQYGWMRTTNEFDRCITRSSSSSQS